MFVVLVRSYESKVDFKRYSGKIRDSSNSKKRFNGVNIGFILEVRHDGL